MLFALLYLQYFDNANNTETFWYSNLDIFDKMYYICSLELS